MSGTTSIIQASPGFVIGTYGAKAVRNAGNSWMTNRPGVVTSGDFTVAQRVSGGANMSVDIAAGAAYLYPASITRQGGYYVQMDASSNTLSAGYTWTPADPTNYRIDLVCMQVVDNAEDAGGSTGMRFRIVDGTASAPLTALTGADRHQLNTTYWPAVPTGCVPIAAVLVPNAATTLTTANITNLNPIAGVNTAYNKVALAESTTSATYTRLTSTAGTGDFCCVYVPHANARIDVSFKSQWKTATAATAGASLFLNGTQMKMPINTGAALTAGYEIALGTANFYSHLVTANTSAGTATTTGFASVVGATADVSDVTTGELVGFGASATTATLHAPISLYAATAGWYIVEVRYKTSASTLSAQNRYMWAEVVG